VGFNQSELQGVEVSCLGEKARGDGDLAQVVKCAGHPQVTQTVMGKSHLFANAAGYLAYPTLMTNGIWIPGRHRGLQHLNKRLHDISFSTGVSPRQPSGRQPQKPWASEVTDKLQAIPDPGI
jgi:hypothetical protein